MYSVFIPFLSRSKTIQRCLNSLHENSLYKHEIVLTVNETDVYYAFNEGVYKCKHDTVVLMNDDMVVCKGWDELIPQYASPERIITTYVVQPRAENLMYGPSPIQHDCGDERNFDYEKFEEFAKERKNSVADYTQNASGWYMPLIINKKTFVTFPNVVKFPECANDFLLFDMIKNSGAEYEFGVINSHVYHFSGASHTRGV